MHPADPKKSAILRGNVIPAGKRAAICFFIYYPIATCHSTLGGLHELVRTGGSGHRRGRGVREEGFRGPVEGGPPPVGGGLQRGRTPASTQVCALDGASPASLA